MKIVLRMWNVVLLFNIFILTSIHSRKTPANQSPLGISRNNKHLKVNVLSGPPKIFNHRQENIDKLKEKVLRKVEKRRKRSLVDEKQLIIKKFNAEFDLISPPLEMNNDNILNKSNNQLISKTILNKKESNKIVVEDIYTESNIINSMSVSDKRKIYQTIRPARRPLLGKILARRKKQDEESE